MSQQFSAQAWTEGKWFVAQCLEIDVASQRLTEDEALTNLRDDLELHFTPLLATVVPDIIDSATS